ncbi:MAG: hypothetical protein HC923_13765 [Myxococcales bacterium]|nr:hypothetical protein [Myxococcales bacterium]
MAPGREAWVGLCAACPEPEDRLIAVIEHAPFDGEAGGRRQLVFAELYAPDPRGWLVSFHALLDQLILTSRGDVVSTNEAH